MSNDKLAEALRKTLPYLRDNAAYYMDDGVNEPLELARDIEELLNAHTADRVPAASVHDDFVAWQCEKCGRYHHKNFPDEGCDWCSGAAISKRLGLSAAAIPQPAQDAKCPYVVTSGEGTSHCRLAEQAAQDAARYRWWRENGYLAVANGDCLDANEVLFAGTEMDEYTDAAMAKESGR